MSNRDHQVVHVALDYGLPSETFVADAVRFTDTGDWRSVLLTGSVQNRDWFPFPPDDRIMVARRLGLPWRAYQRARLHGNADRTARNLWPGAGTLQADIVHAHFGWAAPYAAEVARQHDVPLVTTFHASDLTLYPHLHGIDRVLGVVQGRRHRLDRALPEIDAAITVSDWVTAELRDLGYEGRVEQLPVGIDLERFRLRTAEPVHVGFRIVLVGRLIARKAVDLLLRATARASEQFGEIELVVVGDGPLRDELEALAGELRVEAQFRGAQPAAVVVDELRQANLLVMCSRTTAAGEKESGPMVLKEAMAVGVPVVATDNGDARGVLPPEYRDEIVPEDDVEALAERIVAIAGEAGDARARRVAAGRQWVEKEFDARAIGTRTTMLYESLNGP